MTTNLFWLRWRCLVILALFTLGTCAQAEDKIVTLKGKVFDPRGKCRGGVAVTAYLQNGTQLSTTTDSSGNYKLSVPLDLVVTMDFCDKLFGSTPLDSVAGLVDGQINVVVGTTPRTASEVVTRLANTEALLLRAAENDSKSEELSEQAKLYLRENSTKDMEKLHIQIGKIKMPDVVRKDLSGRFSSLNEKLKKWKR